MSDEIDVRPLTGRIVKPGTCYQGTMHPSEAPGHAVPGFCLVSNDCDWHQAWDTEQETTAAQIAHVRDDHGEDNPERAILRARLRYDREMGHAW